jgi:hypothetical protein
MNIIREESTDTVKFTNFTNETNIILLILIAFFKDNKIPYLQTSNTILISRYEFDKLNENLLKVLLK